MWCDQVKQGGTSIYLCIYAHVHVCCVCVYAFTYLRICACIGSGLRAYMNVRRCTLWKTIMHFAQMCVHMLTYARSWVILHAIVFYCRSLSFSLSISRLHNTSKHKYQTPVHVHAHWHDRVRQGDTSINLCICAHVHVCYRIYTYMHTFIIHTYT